MQITLVQVQPELKFNCFTVGILPLVGCCILTVGYFLMQSIKKSEWPEEFEPADRRTAVNVNLVRKNEKFIVCPCFFLFSFPCVCASYY